MHLHQNLISTLPTVRADLNYLAPMAERPRTYTYAPPEGVPRSNVVNETHATQCLQAHLCENDGQ